MSIQDKAKITFIRLGYANNSSSSHSLIFTGDQDLTDQDDESQEFDWKTFICSSEISKRNYLLCLLNNQWERMLGNRLGLLYPFGSVGQWWMANKETSKIYTTLFVRWLRFNVPVFRKWPLGELRSMILGRRGDRAVSIDHQSGHVCFPIERSSLRWDTKFLDALCTRILNDRFVFLGGNDNDGEHPLSNSFTKYDDNPVLIVWRMMRRGDRILSKKDRKTGEFVVSRMDGPIMKVIL